MSAAIFISYRRGDAAGYAFLLWRELCRRFGNEQVFFDRDDRHHLPAGSDWEGRLFGAIDQARVFIPVIGPDWLAIVDEHGKRRLDDENDVVRREIARALGRHPGLHILPALFGGAAMPLAEQLPADLNALPKAQGRAYPTSLDFEPAFERLVDELVKLGLAAGPASGKLTDRPFHLIPGQLSRFFVDPAGNLPKLRKSLVREHQTAMLPATTLHGMGGVGKTQTAMKYSHEFRAAYAGLWWFGAENTTQLATDFKAFCVANQVPHEGLPPQRAAIDWLARQEPWLLVYDNAEDPAALAEYLPQGGDHHVLITSRCEHWQHAETLRLDVWRENEALAFLRQRLPTITDDERRSLALALGGLPLALEIAAAYLVAHGVAVTDYLKALEKAESAERLLNRDKPATGYPLALYAALTLAVDKLGAAARDLLGICAWFGPEPIPEYLFVEGGELLPEALAAVVADSLLWRETVGELTRHGLAQGIELEYRAPDGSRPTDRTIVLHRLTQQAVRVRLWNAEQGGAGMLAKLWRACTQVLRLQLSNRKHGGAVMLALLRRACPQDVQNPKHWQRLAALTPLVVSCDGYRELAWFNRAAFGWLLNCCATYLWLGPASCAEAVRWFNRALEIARQNFGDEHQATLSVMSNLAGALQFQGDLPGARSLREQELAVCRRVLGEEHPDTLTSMNNLASTLRAQGDLPGGRALQEQALAVRRRVLGEEHPDTLAAMNNLAGALLIQGNLAGARALHEQVLAVCRRVLGDQHPVTLVSMTDIASTLYEQGDLEGARALQHSVLAVRRRVLGDEHPDALISMNNLAGTLRAQDDLAGARALQELALANYRRKLGDENPDTLTAMNNLAGTIAAQGDLAEAQALQEQALTVRRRVLGDEHPSTLYSMNDLAETLREQGDLAEAQALQEQAFAISRRVLGGEHPFTLTSMNNLASTLQAQGDLPGARALEEQALAVRRRVLGEEHPDTLTSMNNLALTLKAQGDLPGARELEEQVLAALCRVLGERHSHTTSSAYNLCGTLLAMHEAAAQEVFQTHLSWLFEAEPGELSADQQRILGNMKEFFGCSAPTGR